MGITFTGLSVTTFLNGAAFAASGPSLSDSALTAPLSFKNPISTGPSLADPSAYAAKLFAGTNAWGPPLLRARVREISDNPEIGTPTDLANIAREVKRNALNPDVDLGPHKTAVVLMCYHSDPKTRAIALQVYRKIMESFSTLKNAPFPIFTSDEQAQSMLDVTDQLLEKSFDKNQLFTFIEHITLLVDSACKAPKQQRNFVLRSLSRHPHPRVRYFTTMEIVSRAEFAAHWPEALWLQDDMTLLDLKSDDVDVKYSALELLHFLGRHGVDEAKERFIDIVLDFEDEDEWLRDNATSILEVEERQEHFQRHAYEDPRIQASWVPNDSQFISGPLSSESVAALRLAVKFFKEIRSHQDFPALLKFAFAERFQDFINEFVSGMIYWPEQQLSFLTPSEVIVVQLLVRQASSGELSESGIRDRLEYYEEHIAATRQRIVLLERGDSSCADEVEANAWRDQKLESLQKDIEALRSEKSGSDNEGAANQRLQDMIEEKRIIIAIAKQSRITTHEINNDLGVQKKELERLLSFRGFYLLLLKLVPADDPSQ